MTRVLTVASIALIAWTQPTFAQTSQSDLSKEAERVLDRLEARGKTLDHLRAKMNYVRVQTLVDETIKRTGSVIYLRKWEPDPAAKPAPDSKDPHAGQRERVFFRVQFDTLTTAGFTSTKKEIYAFDGRWLHELNEKTLMVIHRETVAEDKLLNPTKLGKGPFPAPFGQNKKDVLDNFSVKLIAPSDKDPKEAADHLELVPLPGSDLARTYKKIDLFVSRKLDVPVRMITENKSDEIATADFSDIDTGGDAGAKDLELKVPAGFSESTERLQPAPDKK